LFIKPLLSSNDTTPSIDHPSVSKLAVPNQYSRIRTVSTSSQGSTSDHRHGVADPENASRPLYKKDALFTGSKQQLHHVSHTSLHSNPYMASVTNIPAAINETKKQQSAFRAFADILSAMTDFSILNNKQMLLICIGNIFSMLGYYLPIMCLVSFAAEDHHVDQTKASFLLTIFGRYKKEKKEKKIVHICLGACNTIGRFLGGPIAMLPHLNPLRVHNALLYIAGVLTALAAYAYDFKTCAIYAGLCGFAIGIRILINLNNH
jgi:hypothetical protein